MSESFARLVSNDIDRKFRIMYKIVALCALISVASAGNLVATGPALAYEAAPAVSHVSYSAPAVSHVSYSAPLPLVKAYSAPVVHAPVVHAPAVGTSHQSTVRSLDGNSAISHYSKSVDTAFSSVRKVDTRVTNDAKILTPAVAYTAAAPAHVSYAAPAHVSYAAPAHLSYAPAHLSYAAPAPAHVVSHTTFTGLGAAYAF